MDMKKVLKFTALSICSAITVGMFTACGDDANSSSQANSSTEQQTQAPVQTTTAVQSQRLLDGYEEVEKTGEFIITLDKKNAPETCKNFEALVKNKFYDGLTFHRVINDFMAQGGDPQGNGNGSTSDKEGFEDYKNIKGEFSQNGTDNKLSHKRGVVSMARATDMDSASCQFFICYSDKDTFLDGQYAAFGKVSEGMEVVDDFTNVLRQMGGDGDISFPIKPITITKAEMIDDDKDGNHRVKFSVSYTPAEKK